MHKEGDLPFWLEWSLHLSAPEDHSQLAAHKHLNMV